MRSENRNCNVIQYNNTEPLVTDTVCYHSDSTVAVLMVNSKWTIRQKASVGSVAKKRTANSKHINVLFHEAKWRGEDRETRKTGDSLGFPSGWCFLSHPTGLGWAPSSTDTNECLGLTDTARLILIENMTWFDDAWVQPIEWFCDSKIVVTSHWIVSRSTSQHLPSVHFLAIVNKAN